MPLLRDYFRWVARNKSSGRRLSLARLSPASRGDSERAELLDHTGRESNTGAVLPQEKPAARCDKGQHQGNTLLHLIATIADKVATVPAN